MIQRLERRRVPPEIARIHARYSAGHPRVAIYIRDVDVVHHVDTIREAAAESAVESTTPPRMETLKRRQRNPTDSSKSETESDMSAKSEERYIRRSPVVRT